MNMNTTKRLIPYVQFILLVPALIFMISLLLRLAPPVGSEPARTAIEIVGWYSGKIWTLWVLLSLMPLAALFLGVAAQGIHWTERTKAQVSTLVLCGAALVILIIVGVHVLMN